MKFRLQALQQMREPDELDKPTLLSAPRGWIAVFVVMIIMVGAVAWTFLGTLPISVSAPGLLTRPAGTAGVQSPYAGMVRKVLAQSTAKVSAGQPVAEIEDAGGKIESVTSPFAGHVVGVVVTEGQVIPIGATVVTVERTDAPDDRMIAMVFVPSSRAVQLTPGDAVELSVSAFPPGAFGLLRGRIVSISQYPLTLGALTGLVGDDLAAKRFLVGTTAPRLVIVDLIPDKATRSGYAWSTKSGPPTTLSTQVGVTATIDTGKQTPFDLILGR